MAWKWRSLIAAATMCGWGANASATVVEDAPEAAAYSLVYELNIPDIAGFNSTGVSYAQDQSAAIDFTFDRVAYHLELQRPDEERVFVYVSMPTEVLVAHETGVPHTGTGVFVQQLVEDLHVVSNHPDLAGLSTVDTGSVEFWPSNYSPGNSAQVPGASGDLYDFGDQPHAGAGYGSMQIHDYGTGQTLFAYNSWGAGANAGDLGIGTNPAAAQGAHPDWTFEANAASYTLKRLSVWVRPGAPPQGLALTVESPQAHEVIQRRAGDVGTFEIAGKMSVACDLIEGRLVPLALDGSDAGAPTEWVTIESAPSGSSFVGSLDAPRGWYRLELAVWKAGLQIDTVPIEPVGIGEVFITAGQSNSANHGEFPTSPTDPRVGAWGALGWQHAADPQPIATGAGGSPWPGLGDLLAARFDAPIGLISVGWGGTSVDQWRPYASDQLYQRLLLALGEVGYEGARAILWHQGESDAAKDVSAVDYATQLQEVIDATRADAGWPVAWGVARAAFLPGLSAQSIEAIVAGQQQVIDQDALTFEGPTTEDLLGTQWRYDNVHFNLAGLAEHAKRWDAVIELPPCEGYWEDEDCEEPVADPAPDADDGSSEEADGSESHDANDVGPVEVEPELDAAIEPTDEGSAQEAGETVTPDVEPSFDTLGPGLAEPGCPCDDVVGAPPATGGGGDEGSGCQASGGSADVGPWFAMLLLCMRLLVSGPTSREREAV